MVKLTPKRLFSPKNEFRRSLLSNRHQPTRSRVVSLEAAAPHHGGQVLISPTCLSTAFAHLDPKNVKWYRWLDWSLTLLGATCIKAVRKHVGEIDPRCQFHQHAFTALTRPDPKSPKRQSSHDCFLSLLDLLWYILLIKCWWNWPRF